MYLTYTCTRNAAIRPVAADDIIFMNLTETAPGNMGKA